MAIKSEALGRDLSPAEEKEADTNQDGKVDPNELKAFEEQHPKATPDPQKPGHRTPTPTKKPHEDVIDSISNPLPVPGPQ